MADSDSFDLLDFIKDVGPTIVDAAKYFTGKSQIEDSTGAQVAGLRQSADALKGGYDAKQGIVEQGTDELMNLLTAGLGDVSTKYRNASNVYADDVRNTVTRYDKVMRPELNNLIQGISTGNDIYGLNLDQANADANAELQPYADNGLEATDYLMRVMGLDPSQLTPDQARVMQDYSRDLMAGLAASGLRGAGRAGVAAMNEGRADLGAKLYAINQERADSAAKALSGQGFQASNTISGNDYRTGTSKATNTYNATGDIAKNAYDYGKDIGAKTAAADEAAFGTKYNTSKGIGDLTGQYYQGLGNLQANRYNQRAENTFGKAAVDSTTIGNVTAANLAGDKALYMNDSNALDKLGSILTKQNKSNVIGQ